VTMNLPFMGGLKTSINNTPVFVLSVVTYRKSPRSQIKGHCVYK
jgi:hypothetical protein